VALGAVAALKAFQGNVAGASGAQGTAIACVAANGSDCAGGGGSDLPPPPTAVAQNDVPSCPGGACPGGNRCFAAGTLVATPDGPRPIEAIAAGDIVVSEDENTAQLREERVLQTFVTADRDVLDLYVREDPSPLRVTPGHLFYTLDRGWVPVEALLEGEALVDADGIGHAVRGYGSVVSRETVYNFEVDETHTYFVGPLAILVHNPKKPGTTMPVIPHDEGMASYGGTPHTPPQLPANGAIVEVSNDTGFWKDAIQMSAAQQRPVYFAHNLDPNTPAPPNAPLGGVIYKSGTNPPEPGAGGTTAYIPNALAGKGSLVLGSHGWPGQVQWGGKVQADYDGSAKISASELGNRLAAAGYDPPPGSTVYGLPCNMCTNVGGQWSPGGKPDSSVAQGLANRFGVTAEGLQALPGEETMLGDPKNGLASVGPYKYEPSEAPGVAPFPHSTITAGGQTSGYVITGTTDLRGSFMTCTPN
jgi:hypothetical protein